jgi:hypothetical protein
MDFYTKNASEKNKMINELDMKKNYGIWFIPTNYPNEMIDKNTFVTLTPLSNFIKKWNSDLLDKNDRISADHIVYVRNFNRLVFILCINPNTFVLLSDLEKYNFHNYFGDISVRTVTHWNFSRDPILL